MTDEYLDKVWGEHPEYIRKFYELHPKYERLCDEIEYILTAKIESKGIEYAHIISRAKTLSSFCEKVNRKTYKEPFADITDFAGVRVVYLYVSDQKAIETIIEKEFEVVKAVNKTGSDNVDKFGYGALHYLVRIKEKHSGARYDDLKDLICEVQVKTILQDSWAIVAHHLSYKQETDIPKELRRKLNALSGLFETADDQFESLRSARHKYQEKIKENIIKKRKMSLEQDINLDSLLAYINWKFPDRIEADAESVSNLLEEINVLKEHKYSQLSDINKVIDKSFNAVLEYEKDSPPTESDHKTKTIYAGIGMIRTALMLSDKEYCMNIYSEKSLEKAKAYQHLIE